MPLSLLTRRFNGRSRRTRRIAPAELINAKTAAAAYVLEIKHLGAQLRAIRAKYKGTSNPLEQAQYQREFNMAAHFPVPTYPPDDVINHISITNRWRILTTALLIKRGLHKQRLYDEYINKFEAFGNAYEFTRALKYILKGKRLSTPPRYSVNNPSSEMVTPRTPIYPPLAKPMPPSYSPPPLYHRGGRTRKQVKKNNTLKIKKNKRNGCATVMERNL